MSAWKRLTNVEDQKVDVNMDNIAYIEPQTNGGAWIHFVGGRISEGRTFALGVKETPDAIRLARHLRLARRSTGNHKAGSRQCKRNAALMKRCTAFSDARLDSL
jgi:hypothetical protein